MSTSRQVMRRYLYDDGTHLYTGYPLHMKTQQHFGNGQQGEGFFGDIWSGIKTVGKVAITPLKAFKDATGIAPSKLLILTGDPRAKAAGLALGMAGLGNPAVRKVRKVRKKARKKMKKTKVVKSMKKIQRKQRKIKK